MDAPPAGTDAILDQIRARGGRVTSVGRRILTLMHDEAGTHLPSTEIIRQLNEQEPTSESTVYRSLDRFVDFGVLERHHLGPGPASYHLAAAMHEHVTCTECGTVHDVPGGLLDDVAQRLRAQLGFTLRIGQVSLTGVCADCKDRDGRAAASAPRSSAAGRR
jgi:Fe2+ or Zn2+ uptake regulation protein